MNPIKKKPTKSYNYKYMITGLLFFTLVGIVTKLVYKSPVSWVWVFSPIWIPAGCIIILFIGTLMFLLIKLRVRSHGKKKVSRTKS